MTVSQQLLLGSGGADIGSTIANSLMFDSASTQYLSRTFTTSTTWTLSVWVKRANISSAQGILEGGLIFNADDTLTAFGVTTTAVFRDVSAWYHIVVNSSGLYVNGVSHGTPTTAALTDPDIGRNTTSYFDGYLANLVFVDGSTVAYTEFGRTSPQTGVWVPKAYIGAYGAKGFKLDFADETSTTTLGYDVSGNANHWTLNAMTTANQYQDTPTNGYATLNKLSPTTTATLSSGGTVASASSVAINGFGVSAGSWYWEVSSSGGTTTAGMFNTAATTTTTIATGKTYGFRFNADTGALDYINITDAGSWTSLATGLTSGPYFSYVSTAAATTATHNFGARTFTGTQPTGFKSLCTANLPVPTIKKPTQYFVANTRTGTGATYSVTGKLFSPGLVWIKGRSGATDHAIYDTGRGVEKRIESNNTDAEVTGDTTGLTAFDSAGYTGGALAQINTNAATYVDWLWKESAISGMDIQTYIGNGANSTIAHDLNAVPKMIIVKDRTAASANDWAVYHASLTSNAYYLLLNSTAQQASDATYWNSTTPTSSVFSVGTNADVNTNTNTYVAYLFAEVAGFSKFGSWTNNNSTDGVFVYLGFRPAFILIKNTDNVESWYVLDSARHTYNVAPADALKLSPNAASAEAVLGANTATVDFLSNGFKIRTTNPAAGEISFGTRSYIYAAFAEAPAKYARAR